MKEEKWVETVTRKRVTFTVGDLEKMIREKYGFPDDVIIEWDDGNGLRGCSFVTITREMIDNG
jgi:hypothetical protein